ncbi:heme NO-binding domain-containing protein [Flavobacterium rhizosphaerae]|uniref:Heme NO-binding domain-containing protein n=1 Tax=Flavobacterium rhizosphaerae TaxID=3163298 RepID=A0ABW8YXH3_9FLAO
MYGIIYKTIEQYVTERFSTDQWETIRKNIDIDTSLTDLPYNDALTYSFAITIAHETGMPVEEVLDAIGERIIETTTSNIKGFMDSRGNNFREYLINLPNFHNRMMLIYPELTPPEFRISNINDKSLYVHYVSKTKGLRSFVKGYLKGVAKFFNDPAIIETIPYQSESSPQEVFKISW